MENPSDTYKTLSKPSEEILFKEKKSKFFGYAYPLSSEDEVKPIIEALKKKHHTAGHICYAWQLGAEDQRYRANDDGEPNNSAGLPIYGQIQAYELTNVGVFVARIYGGTKLGVGGLISAYRTAAQMALEEAEIIQKIVHERFQLAFEYPEMDKVMRVLKQNNWEIITQKMEMTCVYEIDVRKTDCKKLQATFKSLHKVIVKKLSI